MVVSQDTDQDSSDIKLDTISETSNKSDKTKYLINNETDDSVSSCSSDSSYSDEEDSSIIYEKEKENIIIQTKNKSKKK